MLITDFHLQSGLQQELLSGEKLLWAGKPLPGIRLKSSDTFLIPFSIFWFGFAIFWTYGASQGSPLFGLFGIPFLLVGFYMAIGRFFVDRYRRANTVYGITNNRVIIKTSMFKTTVQTFSISTLFTMSIEEKADGTGTIKLDTDNRAYNKRQFTLPMGQNDVPQLEFIEHVREVYNLILTQQTTPANRA